MARQETRPCDDCGKPVTKSLPRRRRWLCVECAVARVVAWNDGMRELARSQRW